MSVLLYIPHSSYKTFFSEFKCPAQCPLYIPHSSYKTMLNYQDRNRKENFTSHIVHIKQVAQNKCLKNLNAFTSHIVHIKRGSYLLKINAIYDFTSHIVHIKRNIFCLPCSNISTFTSHIVHIKLYQPAKEVVLDRLYIPHSSYKTLLFLKLRRLQLSLYIPHSSYKTRNFKERTA